MANTDILPFSEKVTKFKITEINAKITTNFTMTGPIVNKLIIFCIKNPKVKVQNLKLNNCIICKGFIEKDTVFENCTFTNCTILVDDMPVSVNRDDNFDGMFVNCNLANTKFMYLSDTMIDLQSNSKTSIDFASATFLALSDGIDDDKIIDIMNRKVNVNNPKFENTKWVDENAF